MNLHGILNKGQGRLRIGRGTAMAVAVGLAMMGGIATAVTASATDHQVWICHATSSDKNPYEIIHTDVNSTVYEGHLLHVTDPPHVWKSGGTFGGVDYTAGPKPDIIGVVDAASPPAKCLATTNDTKFGNLTLKKVVTGGGNATAIDWTLKAAGTSSFEGTTPVSSDVVVGDYKLSETAHSDAQNSAYKASAWDCGSIEVIESTVTVGADENVTCTITNTFVVPLVVDKEVTPAASATQGTCDAAGKVTLVTKTGYSWSGNTGTADVPTYTATAATGYVLTRSGVFTFNGLSRLPSDSAECVVAPAPVVAGVVENAPVVAGVVKNAPVVAGVVKNAPAVKSLAFTGAETVPLGLSGLLALVLGAVLTVASRQRPKQARE